MFTFFGMLMLVARTSRQLVGGGGGGFEGLGFFHICSDFQCPGAWSALDCHKVMAIAGLGLKGDLGLRS